MRISAKLRYGLQLMAELAAQQGRGPAQVADIARRQDLPPKYLHVLMGSLKAAGLVKVQRGPGGGCELARNPARITVLEVVEALEGSFAFTEKGLDPTPGARAVGEVWTRGTEAFREALRGTSLAELASREATLAVGSRDYSI